MIDLNTIFGNVIVELIILVVSFVISFLQKFFSEDVKIKKKEISKRLKFDPLSLSIFLSIVALGNLILNISFWSIQSLTVFFTLCLIVFGYGTVHIFQNQCPACKRFIKVKNLEKDDIKETKKKKVIQPRKIHLYSNGEVWKREPMGKPKTIYERHIKGKNFFECRVCGHKWSEHVDDNLDKEDRTRYDKVIRTNKKDPNASI
jgi:hypothetical protein